MDATKNILMIPFPAFGHLLPLLELAKKIAKFHRVIISVPPFFYRQLIDKHLLPECSTNLDFLVVEGAVIDPSAGKIGIPNLDDLLPSYVPFLHNALCSLASDRKSDCVITDLFFCNLNVILKEKGIPFYHFNTGTGANYLLRGLVHDENCPLWFDEDGAYPIWTKPEDTLQPEPSFEKVVNFNLKQNANLAKGIIINSSMAIELETMKKVHQIASMKDVKLFAVGPLINTEKVTKNEQFFTDWLDKKKLKSVIYISSGTVAAPRAEQLVEMARAFSSLGRPFIWSLTNKLHECLPRDLLAKMEQQLNSPSSNFLILDWVPQKLILAHGSTAVFLSHCGWSSTWESLSNKVPIIGWPMFCDQGCNADLLSNLGVAVVVEGTGMKPKRLVPAAEIAKTIENVIHDPTFAENAAKMAESFAASFKPGGSSDSQFTELIKEISDL